ncbi:hypothetical protein SAMN04488168_12337 [Bacillus sp. 491mf]|uniref:hypothetical protein n=1 Tax=Bacillus sp. 491mf TaxID=1761755 RepID=UPI0008F34575|nr:hypothetical protein [Bacillus sp. 491mf]SFD18414.1 hypothetical protein SAMN04488168_12337 [Bacillus sp. 491mf]
MLKFLQNALINRQKNKEQEKELSAQEMLVVEDIKDNVMITKDKKLVMVFWVSAINLDLMSNDEQIYVFESFEAFLAGQEEGFQIENIAQPVNLRNYTHFLADRHDNECNQFKKRLLASYALFANEQQVVKDVIKKEHYVIIDQKIEGNDEIAYQEALQELRQRGKEMQDQIISMLGQDMNLECYMLSNGQLLALLQIFYNYIESVHDALHDVEVPQIIRWKDPEENRVEEHTSNDYKAV